MTIFFALQMKRVKPPLFALAAIASGAAAGVTGLQKPCRGCAALETFILMIVSAALFLEETVQYRRRPGKDME